MGTRAQRREVNVNQRLDPKSTAGVLLREHDNAAQALRYAERKAEALCSMHNAIGLDYAEAARQLRQYIANEGE